MIMTKTEIKTLLPWRSVTSDAVEYDPLTGNYRYTETYTPPNEYNEYWTPMGQPRRNPIIEDKEKSPRKEKKKKKKPK